MNNESDVKIERWPAEKFNGESGQLSFLQYSVLFAVSIQSFVTNNIKAILIKLLQSNDTSLKKILWKMGRDKNHTSSIFFDRFSRYNKEAKVVAASWRSMELFYDFFEKTHKDLKNNLEGRLTSYWGKYLANRKAVVNRKKIVTFLLRNIIASSRHDDIRILSIASGSAVAVLDALKQVQGVQVQVVFIDLDSSAINAARQGVINNGLELDRFQFVNDSTDALEDVCGKFKPNIVEMVGFLDYKTEEGAIRLIKRIYNCLPSGGWFLTGNIKNNREKIFLDWVLLWPMLYKNEYELADILKQSGFQAKNISLVYEPLDIHGVAVCRK